MTGEDSLWLATLLHDIGKFWENVEPAPTDLPRDYRQQARYSHEPYSAWFLHRFASNFTDDLQVTEQVILKHHAPTLPDEILVQIADWLASYERAEAQGDEEGARGKRDTLLRSILTRLHREPTPPAQYHALRPLRFDRDTLFPSASPPAANYSTVWQAFIAEIERIPTPHPYTLQALLYKYFWSAPSDRSPANIPDISLYHHLVSAAAIAVCLARAHFTENDLKTLQSGLKALWQDKNIQMLPSEQQRLLQQPIALLVKGDISGTQDFLYLLTSRGAARGLRGRSFYLQLLTEVVARWMLRQLKLPSTNLMYAGGGHFYLLVPFANKSELNELRHSLSEKLWQAHRGDLSMTLAETTVAPVDFVSKEGGGNGFAEKWQSVSEDAAARKARRWQEMGLQLLFTPHQEGATADEMCQICHGEWKPGMGRTEEGIRKCRRCAAFEDLGRELRQPAYLAHFVIEEQPLPPVATWHDVLKAFGVDVRILSQGEKIQPPANAREAILERVDDTDFLSDKALEIGTAWNLPVAFGFRLLADATPYDERKAQVADFDHLAESSQGIHWLGVLRMDVDSLGEIFRNGLGDDATLSRIATLSGALRLFFEAWVPLICRQHNQQGNAGKVYLLYAGGDDLFVVGSWSALPEIAMRIRRDFHDYVGGKHVTISAGIAIQHDKYPLYRLANEAKHALDDRAKNLRPEKDAICFLEEAIAWEQMEQVEAWKNRLLEMLHPDNGKERVSRALLTRLMEISALYRANVAVQRKRLRHGEITEQQYRSLIDHDRWRWRMAYHLSRFAQRYRSHEEALQHLQDALSQKGLITNIHIAARWAELLTREEK
jgi:CRISPR-associated protein Csm1